MVKKVFLVVSLAALFVVSTANAYISNPSGSGNSSVSSGTVLSLGSPFTIQGTATSTVTGDATNSVIQKLNTIFYVPNDFAANGCFGSSTLKDFGGCVNYAYSLANASSVTIIVPNITVTQAQWTTPIVFASNMVIPSLQCPGNARLAYGGTGKAVTFNFNVSGAHDVSHNTGCTYLGASTVLSAGATNLATTTGFFLGGSTGNNAANGITVEGNTFNGFGTQLEVATNTYMITVLHNSFSGGNGGNANQPNRGSLIHVNPASNSGERNVWDGNNFTDPGNSSATNAIYLADGAAASNFFTNNSFDDVSVYVGFSNGQAVFDNNHWENASAINYGAYNAIYATSSAATQITFNGNEIANDPTSASTTFGFQTFIKHGVNLYAFGNHINNYNGATLVTFADHSLNNGSESELICGLAVQSGSLTNIVNNQTYSAAAGSGCWQTQANSFPYGSYIDSANVVHGRNGNGDQYTFSSGGVWTFSNNGTAGGPYNFFGSINATGSISANALITGKGGFKLQGASSTFTTASIGGGSLTAGTCASTTVVLDPNVATSSAVFPTSPTADPGPDFYWETVLIASSSVSTRVCAAGITGTPTSTTYNVKIIQ